MKLARVISKLRSDLIVSDQPTHNYLAALGLRLSIEETTSVPTAATDGKRILLNPDWFGKLKWQEQRGVFVHEVYHAALGHCWRRPPHIDAQLWNIAADIMVNGLVLQNGFSLPKDRVEDPNLQHLSVEEIVLKLMDDAEEVPMSGGVGEGGFAPDDISDSLCKSNDDKDAMQREWAAIHKDAAARVEDFGRLPAELQREIGAATVKKVDWRALCWAFMETASEGRDDYCWSSPNRRYITQDIYLPTMTGVALGELVAVIDTSGSIDQAILNSFVELLTDLHDSMNPERTHLVWADADVAGVQTFERDDEIADLKPAGFGGTDFRPAFRWIEENADPVCVFYLTDLWGSFPDQAPPWPTLWLCINDQVAPFGETVKIEL